MPFCAVLEVRPGIYYIVVNKLEDRGDDWRDDAKGYGPFYSKSMAIKHLDIYGIHCHELFDITKFQWDSKWADIINRSNIPGMD